MILLICSEFQSEFAASFELPVAHFLNFCISCQSPSPRRLAAPCHQLIKETAPPLEVQSALLLTTILRRQQQSTNVVTKTEPPKSCNKSVPLPEIGALGSDLSTGVRRTAVSFYDPPPLAPSFFSLGLESASSAPPKCKVVPPSGL
jgi:hypothetical protein